MKKLLQQIIDENNHPEKGIKIPYDTGEYTEKLLKNATIIPYYEQERILGFIAFYANDPKKENAFLTMILISTEAQNRGIGKFLLDFSIQQIRKKGFKQYNLEVLKSNTKAISFYRSFDFIITKENETFYVMTKQIQQI